MLPTITDVRSAADADDEGRRLAQAATAALDALAPGAVLTDDLLAQLRALAGARR
jgi:hypothetical protein